MNNKDYVKNLFEGIAKEASVGNVNCFFRFNVLFDTLIEGQNFALGKDNEIKPVLNIQDYEKFLEKLEMYLENARYFYKDDIYLNDTDETQFDKDKIILTVLWSNATWEDFNNPNEFLQKRINFFDMPILGSVNTMNCLNSDLIVNFKKASLLSETPYYLNAKLTNYENEYMLPNVYFGISDNKAYLYAVQDKNKSKKDTLYSKKINRLLYKVNEGFDAEYESNFDESLKDVSPGFVVSVNVLLGSLSSAGIQHLITSSILPVRYNNKLLNKNNKYDEQQVDELQNNITQKLIRTVLRVLYHQKSCEVVFYPMDVDFNLHVLMNNNQRCNNDILNESFNVNKNLSL